MGTPKLKTTQLIKACYRTQRYNPLPVNAFHARAAAPGFARRVRHESAAACAATSIQSGVRGQSEYS